MGVGPGDPDLLTLQGLSVLRVAERIVVPVRDDTGEEGYAERVVRAHLPDAPIVRAPFALTDRGGVTPRRQRAWDAAARLVAEAFTAGAAHVAFATIGDPNVYSTFGYLAAGVRERCPYVEVRTVPGITAMQALAAASGTVLGQGRDPLVLLPTADVDGVWPETGTVVVYKAGRHWPELREWLAEHGRLGTAVVGSHLGRPDEVVRAAADVTGELPYLSTVIAP